MLEKRTVCFPPGTPCQLSVGSC